MIPQTGPYLKAAAFCESVIEGKDGVLSLIRIIDRLTITSAGSEAPAEMPPFESVLRLVLMFISGRARGNQTVQVRVERPDGTHSDAWSGTVFFEGEDRGANLVMEIATRFQFEGLYWFDVMLSDEQMTRIPFRVIYQRAVSAMA